MLLARREFHLDLRYEELDAFYEEIKSSILHKIFPENYTVDVYKDLIVCCGIFPMGIAIEIEGPAERKIRDLDLQMYSKIIENCEQKNIEYHESEPLEIL